VVLANKWRWVDAVINQVCIDTCRGNQMPKRKQGTVSLVWRGQSGRVRGVDVVRALAHWEYSIGLSRATGKRVVQKRKQPRGLVVAVGFGGGWRFLVARHGA